MIIRKAALGAVLTSSLALGCAGESLDTAASYGSPIDLNPCGSLQEVLSDSDYAADYGPESDLIVVTDTLAYPATGTSSLVHGQPFAITWRFTNNTSNALLDSASGSYEDLPARLLSVVVPSGGRLQDAQTAVNSSVSADQQRAWTFPSTAMPYASRGGIPAVSVDEGETPEVVDSYIARCMDEDCSLDAADRTALIDAGDEGLMVVHFEAAVEGAQFYQHGAMLIDQSARLIQEQTGTPSISCPIDVRDESPWSCLPAKSGYRAVDHGEIDQDWAPQLRDLYCDSLERSSTSGQLNETEGVAVIRIEADNF